ncbi:MAG: hypothetical protein AAFO75_04530 [Pseudomonadota bacterium]
MTIKHVNLPSNIAFPVRIIEVHVTSGQMVSPGTPLYTIETADKKCGILRAPITGTVTQGPVAPNSSFAQAAPVLGLEVTTSPSLGPDHVTSDPTGPKAAASRKNTAVPQPMSAPPTPGAGPLQSSQQKKPPKQAAKAQAKNWPKPSVGLALVALVGGALLTSLYVFASIYIPLMMFGIFIPLSTALFLIGLSISALRGPMAFRISVAAIGFVLNVVALWFTVFWARYGLDNALLVFTNGPQVILEGIVVFSHNMELQLGDVKAVLSGSGAPVTGVGLQIIWLIEAALFAAAPIFGYVNGSKRQHELAASRVRDNASQAFSRGKPAVIAIAIGTLKTFLKLGALLGVVMAIDHFF